MAKRFLGNRTIIALSFITLLLGSHTAHAAKRKRATSPAQAPFPAEPSITYLPAISQGTYQANPQHNLYKGNALCGLFATFNAACMLDDAHNRPRQKKLSWVQDIARFNTWLKQRETIVRQLIEEAESRPRPAERGFGNLHEGELSRLLSLPSDNFYRENSTFLELENLHTYFVTENRTNHFVPPSDDLIEAITLYRTTRTPHAIIFNTGGHWISILLAADGSCKVADSLNAGTANKRYVKIVYQLFTQQPLLDVTRLAQLRQQYGHQDREDESEEEADEEEEPAAETDDSSSDSEDENNFFAPRRKQAKPSNASPSPQSKTSYDQKAYEKAHENKGKQDLKGANLRGADLSGLNLEGADFTDADLTGANLSNACLNKAKFIRTVLNGTNFSGAKLRKARFINVNHHVVAATVKVPICFDQADMIEAVIENSDFSGNAKEPRAIFIETILDKVTIRNSDLQGAFFQAVQLDEASFIDVDLSCATLQDLRAINGLSMERVCCFRVVANYLDLVNARFAQVRWDKAKITDFVMSANSIIKESSFRYAEITKWYCENAILADIDFTRARLDQCCICAPVILKRKLSKECIQALRDFAFYRDLEDVEYTIRCLGWNLNFDYATMSSCYFIGGDALIKDEKFFNTIIRKKSGKVSKRSPLTSDPYRHLPPNPYLRYVEKTKVELANYDQEIYEEVRAIGVSEDDKTRGAFVGGIGGLCIGLVIVTPAGLIGMAACALGGVVTASIGGEILDKECTSLFSEKRLKGFTFLIGASFNKTSMRNTLFEGVNLASSKNMREASSTVRTDFRDCDLPSEEIQQLLRSKGCRVNGIANMDGYRRIWGSNPDLRRDLHEMLRKFVISIPLTAIDNLIGKAGSLVVEAMLPKESSDEKK